MTKFCPNYKAGNNDHFILMEALSYFEELMQADLICYLG
jgi:hypothetical protein